MFPTRLNLVGTFILLPLICLQTFNHPDAFGGLRRSRAALAPDLHPLCAELICLLMARKFLQLKLPFSGNIKG